MKVRRRETGRPGTVGTTRGGREPRDRESRSDPLWHDVCGKIVVSHGTHTAMWVSALCVAGLFMLRN